jgi:dihydrofolate synthase/folylpolyglutamate synthase
MTELQKLEALLESLGGEKRIHYALEHFKAALTSVGDPQKSVKTILIGGTNGKGTTTLFISQALKAYGLKVSTYLSPHLQSPTERILTQLTPAPTHELLALALEFEPTARRFSLTYFEFLTLLFFIKAQRNHSDFSVVEVGLGGRLDSTNVTDPIATVLTNIALDHEWLLGNTHHAILKEKLGVLRQESLLFTGIKDPELLKTVEERCSELDAIFYYSKELRIKVEEVSWEGQRVLINDYPFYLTNPSLGTVENAALAFLTLRIAFPAIPISTLQEAFRQTKTPGRFEIVSHTPRIILSGDHNPAGLKCLKDTLASISKGKLFTVCGFSPDKAFLPMYQELTELSDEILLTQIPRLQDKYPDNYRMLGAFEPEPIKAIERMSSKLKSDDILLITGSLYLVGEVRKLWKEIVEF